MHAYTFVYILIGCQASVILGLDINVRCDDQSIIYVDGVFKGNTTVHYEVYQGQVADTAKTIAVYCYNKIYSGGILFSASNGLISDANWKCSDDEENGWFNQDFDDRHWTSAYVIGSNAQNPASLRKSEEILDDAKFISSTSNYRQHHHGFYCRGSLGPVSALVRCSDIGQIIVDGISAGRTDSREEAWRGTFDSVPHLLSVKCQSVGRPGGGGIMGSVSTGVVTDQRWKCSDTFQDSWTQIRFDDSGPQWSEAFVVAGNVLDNLGSVRDERFPGTANRIWSRPDSVYAASTAYCRVILGIQILVKTTPNTTAEIYIDGQKHWDDVHPDEQWVDIVSNTTQLIAIHGSSSWSEQPAVMVSLSNDVADGSSVNWTCTSKLYPGWEKLGFDDSDWSYPLDNITVAGQTSGQAVWAADANTTLETQDAYCRGTLECHCPQLCQPEVIGHHLTIKCACYEGYTLAENETVCEDVDECKSVTSLCEHHCINIPGSYYCKCADGYRVSPVDNSKCVDIDECKETMDNCTDSQQCANTDGGFQCIFDNATTEAPVVSSLQPSPSPPSSSASSESSVPATKPGSTTTPASTTTTTAQQDVVTGSTDESTDASSSSPSSTTSKSGKLNGAKASLNPVAIVVPVIIGVLLIAVAVIVLFFVRRKRRRAMGGVQYSVSNPLVDSWSQHAQDSGIRYQDLADH